MFQSRFSLWRPLVVAASTLPPFSAHMALCCSEARCISFSCTSVPCGCRCCNAFFCFYFSPASNYSRLFCCSLSFSSLFPLPFDWNHLHHHYPLHLTTEVTMAKRRPDIQLTKDNFDQEDRDDGDAPEYTGPMKVAAEEVLKTRTIVKAKRRVTGGGLGGGEDASNGLFSGLKSKY